MGLLVLVLLYFLPAIIGHNKRDAHLPAEFLSRLDDYRLGRGAFLGLHVAVMRACVHDRGPRTLLPAMRRAVHACGAVLLQLRPRDLKRSTLQRARNI